MLFISYVPLLSDPIGMTTPLDKKETIMEMLLDASKEYVIQQVAWVPESDGKAHPTLILPHAKKIRDHMLEWSDRDPKRYFTLVWQSFEQGGYTLVILPDFERSARRFHTRKGVKAELTIVGHVFTYYVKESDSFNSSFLSNRKDITIGFGEKIENNQVIKYSDLCMKIKHISELSRDEKKSVEVYLKVNH